MISNRIKQLRNALGLTQAEFGNRIGANFSSISDWEIGKVEAKPVALTAIELTFNVNPEWLREGKGEMFLPTLNAALLEIFESLKTLPESKQTWAAEEILMKTDIRKLLGE